MTTTMIDRAAVRTAFAALLSAELVGTGKPAEAVYAYPVADLQGKSPVVFLKSAGSFRRDPEDSHRSESLVFLDAHIFVLYSDQGSWTEQHSSARLDLIEKIISQVVVNNKQKFATGWMSIDFAGRSEVTSVVLGGKDYDWEIIPLAFELLGA